MEWVCGETLEFNSVAGRRESGIPSILGVTGNPNRFDKYVRGATTNT